jgi:hypothetical protein
MTQLFGDFNEEILVNNKLFVLDFFINSIPVDRYKQTRYLSVAFIADYLANFFHASEEDIAFFEKQLEVKSAATYITNELLENSMRFHQRDFNYPIQFGVGLFEEQLFFISTNCVTPIALNNLKYFINELLISDIDELYFRQLEQGAEEKSNQSRLGLLSMMNDYSAKLGWKIEAVNPSPEIICVTTMVQLKT